MVGEVVEQLAPDSQQEVEFCITRRNRYCITQCRSHKCETLQVDGPMWESNDSSGHMLLRMSLSVEQSYALAP
ncbi:MAG: hypothetical protein DI625_08390 [Sphingomonas sp.]|nr:MAG: hypothetical protein DI625_08390 [Sphingomonas sp.]